MEQNLPEDYTHLLVSSALRDPTPATWDHIYLIWSELYRRNLAMVDVGGLTLKESLANCFKNIQPAAPWPTGAEIMSIHGAITSFANAQFIEVEIYYIAKDELGNYQLRLSSVGSAGGLIYRICVLPTLRCVLVVGGNSKEVQLLEKRTRRLKTLVELIARLKNNPDELAERLVADYETKYQSRVASLLGELKKPMVGVIGSAGVGKSTLLNKLIGAGLLPRDNGAESVTAFPTIVTYANIAGIEVSFEYNTLDEIKATLQRLLAAKDDDESSPKDTQSVFLSVLDSGAQKDATTVNQRAKAMLDALNKKDLTGLDVSLEILQVLQKIVAGDSEKPTLCQKPSMVLPLLSLSKGRSALIKKATIRGGFASLEHVDLVDLPGLGDVIEHRSQLTLNFVKQCDFVFYVRKERFGTAESKLYTTLLDLQVQFAIIYTNFFNTNDASSLITRNQDISQNSISNFSRCLVAKHFNEIATVRKLGTDVEKRQDNNAKGKDILGTNKLAKDSTSRVPIITVESQWPRAEEVSIDDETAEAPFYLCNLPTVQFYIQYVANAIIKAHSDAMAEVMEQWFHSIRNARKKPVIESTTLHAVVKKFINTNHTFDVKKLSEEQVLEELNLQTDDLPAIKESIVDCFRDYNGHYVRGRSWSSIVGYAIGGSSYGLNAAFYRPVLHAFTQTFSPMLLETASGLVRQVLDYIDSTMRALNERIAKETANVLAPDQKPLEAQLAVTLAKKVHDIPVAAKKEINSLLDKLLNVVTETASPIYEDASMDGGSGVVKRVSNLLSEDIFVSDVLRTQIEYVAEDFLPYFYKYLAQMTSTILNDFLGDTLRAFEPLTIGTPVTLDELMRHAHFKEIVELLKNIAEDATNLH